MYINKYLSSFFVFILFFFACKSGGPENKIANLEQAAASNPTAEVVQELLGLYQTELGKTELDIAAKATTIGKMAQLQLNNKQIPAAIQTLKNGIAQYYAAPGTADNVWSLGQVFKDQLNKPTVATTIQKVYTQLFPSGTYAKMAQNTLAQDTTSLTEHMDALGSKMYNEKTHRLDTRAAGDFIESCDVFALLKPEDPKSPDYLHKAGETARAIRAFPRAIEIYDRIYTNYPSFEKAPQALFLKAFTYDNDLKEYDKARALYTAFLEKYPNDDFADDTQFLLKNLGKSDEEIIQSFSKDKKAN